MQPTAGFVLLQIHTMVNDINVYPEECSERQ